MDGYLLKLHAVYVQEMNHWEAEQVALPDGPDRDYARQKFNEVVNRAADLKKRIAEAGLAHFP